MWRDLYRNILAFLKLCRQSCGIRNLQINQNLSGPQIDGDTHALPVIHNLGYLATQNIFLMP